MKILVTGGAGFIGSNFIHYWIDNNPDDQIINFDKLTYAGNLKNLSKIENNKNYTFIKGDICNKEQVEDVVKGVDVVVHFAAESHVDRSISDSTPFVLTNILGTQILLEAALKNKNLKRFHHVSTDEVFGALPLESKEKFNEETKYNPRNPYSASKAAADHLVRSYHKTYNLPITISNCSNNYGPYHFPEKLFPLAITNLIEGKKVPIYGDGLYVRDWLYVKDHALAIEKIIKEGRVGETYMIGGQEEEISNIDIIRMMTEIMNKDFDKSVEYIKDRPNHDRKYSVDWTKINQELKWSPTVDLKDGMKQTIEWYLENKEWWEEIKSGEYLKYYKEQYER